MRLANSYAALRANPSKSRSPLKLQLLDWFLHVCLLRWSSVCDWSFSLWPPFGGYHQGLCCLGRVRQQSHPIIGYRDPICIYNWEARRETLRLGLPRPTGGAWDRQKIKCVCFWKYEHRIHTVKFQKLVGEKTFLKWVSETTTKSVEVLSFGILQSGRKQLKE